MNSIGTKNLPLRSVLLSAFFRVLFRMVFRTFWSAMAIAMFIPRLSFGQWQQIGGFNSGIYSIYFLDQFSEPGVGFVGLGNGLVYRTSDEGQSWTECAPFGTQGAITSFSFGDALHGFLTCRQKNGTGGIYETGDGGLTWSPVLDHLPSGDFWCVCYANQRLFVTGNNITFQSSIDAGAHWIPVTAQPSNKTSDEQNGIAFNGENASIGVVSDYSGWTLFTQDGGADWQQSNYFAESWNPVAIGGSSFFAVSEATWYVSRCIDSGQTWSVRGKLPIKPTGDINGTCQQLYVQTIAGLFVSNDEALTWHPIGGPGNTVDTRFYVLGGWKVFAGDSLGRVFKLLDTLRNSTTPLSLTGAGMESSPPQFLLDGCSPIDTSIFVYATSGCSTTQLLGYSIKLTDGLRYDSLHGRDSIRLQTSIVDTLDTVSVGFYPIPVTFATNSSDSVRIRLHYTPSASTDSAIVTLHYSIDDLPVDTSFVITFARNARANLSIPKGPILLTAKQPCIEASATFSISNGPCDSVTVLKVWPNDSIHFSSALTTVPISTGPDGSIRITIEGSGSEQGTLQTTFYFLIGNGSVVSLDSIPAELIIEHNGTPHVAVPDGAAVPATNICAHQLATFSAENLGCELLVFDSAVWIQSIPDLNIVQMPTFPDTLLPSAKDSIVVEFSPSAIQRSTAEMEWFFHGNGGTIDTIVQIHTSSFDLSRATLSDSSLDFDSISICASDTLSLYIDDESCKPTTVEALYGPNDVEFQLLSPSLRALISPGDSVQASIVLAPQSIGNKSDSIQLILRDSSGATQILNVALHGFVVPDTARAIVSPFSIAIDSIPPCGSFDSAIAISNISHCVPVTISATLTGGSWFSMDSSGVPITLTPGNSIRLPIDIQANADSAQNGTISIVGDGIDTTIVLHAATVPLDRPEITASYPDSIFSAKLCQSATHQFTLHNWKCEPVEINSIALTGNASSLTILSPVTTDSVLAPGDSLVIVIGFDAEDTLTHPAELQFTTADGNVNDRIPLSTITTTRPQLAGIFMQSSDGLPLTERRPGDTISILLTPMSDVSDTLGLTAISAHVDYDGNLLTYFSSAALSSIPITTNPSENAIDLEFSSGSPIALSKNVPIARAQFTTTFSEPKSTSVTLNAVAFNHGDSDFSRCVLASEASGNFTFSISPFCGDSDVADALLELPLVVDGVDAISKNGMTSIQVNLTCAQQEAGQFVLYDERGAFIKSFGSYTLMTGSNEIFLPAHVPNGVYFLTIESNGITLSKKFTVIQ